MKQYKLKKDLPTFNGGDEFYLDNNNDLRLKGSDIMAYNHKTLEKFPNILKDWFEEIHDDKRWRAEYAGRYWCTGGTGGIYSSTEDGHKADNYRFCTGNYFKTEEDAEVYKKYLIARQILLDDAEGGKFFCEKHNWYVFYDKDHQNWECDWGNLYYSGTIYFKTKETLKKSLEEHKEQWEIVRKYEMGEE
ncbi:hypothetical protein HG470_001805 [Candidatus Saccharibacteria bacterium]|nr:hypothetical protein [Candidatus Saccharibacteria bacterium]